MKIKIRQAGKNDFEIIQKMNAQLFVFEEDNFSPRYNINWPFEGVGINYFKKSIVDKNACTIIAEIDGVVRGYLIGWLKKTSSLYRLLDKEAELENMFVSKKFRNKGIGNKLVKEFLGWCKQREVQNICVGALAQNKSAHKLYKSIGFKEYEVRFEIKL